MGALEAIRVAIDVLWPVISQAADYLRGERDDLPEVPGTLRSRLELERAKRRRRKQ